MTEGKYIIYADGDVQVFGNTRVYLWEVESHGGTPVRAGRFHTSPDGILFTGGESTTLGIRGNAQDAEAVSEALKDKLK